MQGKRFQRPAWTTGTLIPASFLCGIFAAVFIWRGGQKTKRVGEVEERLRAALDAEIPPDFETSSFDGTRQRITTRSPELSDAEKQVTNEAAIDEHMVVPAAGHDGEVTT